ncbi:Rab interacting lysosomal protein-like 1 [Homalodisca vitripennis]|nr:Rab interacting lysosomal protein-like 1 [Homalodisca vitripennis]
MPFNESMEDYESEVSVIDVYDIASEIGKEFEKIIDCYGSEAVTGLMPKVITALEHLEVLATKNERENSNVQDLEAKILKLESDKLEKAEDRLRYERILSSTNLPLNSQWFQQDGATSHTAVNNIAFLQKTFGNRLIISFRKNFPYQSHSPNLTTPRLRLGNVGRKHYPRGPIIYHCSTKKKK